MCRIWRQELILSMDRLPHALLILYLSQLFRLACTRFIHIFSAGVHQCRRRRHRQYQPSAPGPLRQATTAQKLAEPYKEGIGLSVIDPAFKRSLSDRTETFPLLQYKSVPGIEQVSVHKMSRTARIVVAILEDRDHRWSGMAGNCSDDCVRNVTLPATTPIGLVRNKSRSKMLPRVYTRTEASRSSNRHARRCGTSRAERFNWMASGDAPTGPEIDGIVRGLGKELELVTDAETLDHGWDDAWWSPTRCLYRLPGSALSEVSASSQTRDRAASSGLINPATAPTPILPEMGGRDATGPRPRLGRPQPRIMQAQGLHVARKRMRVVRRFEQCARACWWGRPNVKEQQSLPRDTISVQACARRIGLGGYFATNNVFQARLKLEPGLGPAWGLSTHQGEQLAAVDTS